MLGTRSKQRGITMMEIMVTLAIIAILLAIGVPNLSVWLQNTQVNATAESVMSGLQLARAEAVRQNTRARFMLPGAAGLSSWAVASDSLTAQGTFPNPVQNSGAKEAGSNARLGVSASTPALTQCCTTAIAAGTGMGGNPSPGVVFNAFGQSVADSTITKISRIDVTNPGTTRRLVILISDSGAAKVCNPALPATNSRGCP